ncbi:MAG: efflux RND transporter periplasmic adaptor subunit [Rhodospirillaceae bacterium]|nr:efflux RND transporter periplasmic adaptor subunit [Rhodospirillaceae bacterium]
MKRFILTTVAVLAISAGAFHWYANGQTVVPATYQTATAELGSLETVVTAVGSLEPLNSVEVGAQVSGQIVALHVAEGDVVEQGDLLAEIDTTVYEAAVAADRADLLSLAAQRDQRAAELTLAQQRLGRQEQLMASRATSQDDYDAAVAEVAIVTAEIAALDAEIAKAESELAADQANLSYTRITAPMSGTVLSLSVRQGQTVNANQSTPTILELANLEVMTVRAEVSEADVGQLTPGMDAYFTTLGDAQRRWEGSLRQILPEPEVENNVVLYYALFEVDNDEHRLLPSMTAQVFFVVGRVADAVMVPATALTTNADGSATVQVLAGGVARTREVTVALQNRISAAVTAGLEAGEQVIIGQATTAAATSSGAGGPPSPFGF